MPNNGVIDNLSIEIVGKAEAAIKELGRVEKALSQLQSVISTLSGTRITANFITPGAISRISQFADAVNKVDVSKMVSFTSALSALGALSGSNIRFGITDTTVNNLAGFSTELNRLDVAKLSQLSTINLSNLSSLSNISSAAKSLQALATLSLSGSGTNLSGAFRALEQVDTAKLADIGKAAKGLQNFSGLASFSRIGGNKLRDTFSALSSVDLTRLYELSRIDFSNMRDLADASRVIRNLNDRLKESSSANKKFSSSMSSARKAAHGASRSFNLANTALGKLFNSIKRIAFYRMIRSAIRGITKGFAEGIENLYRWSQAWGTSFAPAMDQLKTAQLYLKNGFASMFSPLIEYAVPIIDTVVDKIVDMFNAVQELFAQLTGAATWNKAIKYPVKYKDDLDAAAGSAKALQNILMDFDEINAINTPHSGSRGSGKEAEDYSKMFELVQTSTKSDSALSKFMESLNKLNFDPLKNSLKNLWNEGINPILTYFKENAGKFLSPLVEFFVEEGLPIAINLVTAALKPFLDIVKPLFESGFFEDVAGKLSKVNASVQKFADFLGTLDFSPIGEALASLWNNTLSPIIDKLIQYADFIRENVIQPITQFLVEKGIPAAIGAIESALSAIWSILEPILDGLEIFWSENGSWIMELFEGQTMTALGKIKEAFGAIGKFFQKNGDKVRSIFSNLSKIIKDLSPAIKKIVEMIGTATWDSFVDTIQNILTLLQPILDLASGILNLFTAAGDKEKAKKGLKEIGQAIWDGLKAPFEIVLRVLASVLDTIGHIFPGCKEAAHAIRVLIGDEIEEVNDKVRVGNELITKSEKKVDEYGNYVSVTGKKISAAQDEINQKRAEEIKKVQELGVTNSDMAREMTEWYNYCTEQGLEPMTGQIIFTAEQARILGVAVQGVATSANSISVKPVTTLDDAIKYLVTDVQKMSPAAKTAFTQSEEYMKQCKKWGIDPLTGAILDLQRDANGLPYKLKPGFTSIQEYASATATHVKNVFKDALSNKNGNTFGADFGKGFADALKSALERTNFSAAIDIQEVTHQTIVQYKKQVNLDYEGQKMAMRGFASGGFPDQGSLFYAGEGSAELLGTVGGRTAVAGEKEITGIRDAIIEQGQREEGLLRQLISAVANKDLTLVANSKTGRWVNQSLRAYAGVTG